MGAGNCCQWGAIFIIVSYSDVLCFRCNCKVHEAVSGKLIKDHGILEKYSWPSADCHYVHQRCRAMCRQKLDLKTLNKDKTSLGYEYCSLFGQVTKGVELVAEWTTHGCPHDMHLNSKKKMKLCCGHSPISIKGGKVIQAFGWNPDCKAQSFVLGN